MFCCASQWVVYTTIARHDAEKDALAAARRQHQEEVEKEALEQMRHQTEVMEAAMGAARVELERQRNAVREAHEASHKLHRHANQLEEDIVQLKAHKEETERLNKMRPLVVMMRTAMTRWWCVKASKVWMHWNLLRMQGHEQELLRKQVLMEKASSFKALCSTQFLSFDAQL